MHAIVVRMCVCVCVCGGGGGGGKDGGYRPIKKDLGISPLSLHPCINILQ